MAPAPTGNTFTVQSGNQSPITITVSSTTKYYLVSLGGVRNTVDNQISKERRANPKLGVPGAMNNLHIPANWRDNLGWLDTFNKSASFTDIALGDRIIARVDSGNNAYQVLIIKGPVIRQVRGTVTVSGIGAASGTITIAALNGTTVGPLNWDSNTEFIIKGTVVPSGQYAAVTYNSNTNNVQLVNFTAKAPNVATTTTTTTTTTTS